MITSKINNLKYIFNSKQNIVRPLRPNQSQIVSCIHNIRFTSLNMSSIAIFDGNRIFFPKISFLENVMRVYILYKGQQGFPEYFYTNKIVREKCQGDTCTTDI